MWKDLSVPPDLHHQDVRRQRYMAYVDYLGTSILYRDAARNADRIEDRRYELEHSIHIRLQGMIADKKIEIGVFSDTVMIVGCELTDVLAASASILEYGLAMNIRRGDPEDIRLLRGGVSAGPELRSSYLKSGPGVSIIPFFDGSLAFAYALEGLRRGSRIYIAPEIAKNELRGVEEFLVRWKRMPGTGVSASSACEFLWPAFALQREPGRISKYILDSFVFWRRAVQAVPYDPVHYRETLYHFDETIKCLVRSTLPFKGRPEWEGLLATVLSLLPKVEDAQDDIHIRYVWGLWFQVMLIAAKAGDLSATLGEKLPFVESELKRRGYWDKFVAETDYDDYSELRRGLGL